MQLSNSLFLREGRFNGPIFYPMRIRLSPRKLAQFRGDTSLYISPPPSIVAAAWLLLIPDLNVDKSLEICFNFNLPLLQAPPYVAARRDAYLPPFTCSLAH